MPFNVVGNLVFVRNVRHSPIYYSTLMKYMNRLITHVEEEITIILPSKFGLVVDGWSALDIHYLAVFATFPANTETKYDQVLLGFSPFENEENMKPENHVDFIKFVLDLFD